jgi:hypothetical protein
MASTPPSPLPIRKTPRRRQANTKIIPANINAGRTNYRRHG